MQNKTEAEFERKAALDGWIVTKRGWPDFICRRGLEVMAVEVKESDWLSAEQEATMKDLYVVGIKTLVWTRGGFQAFPAQPIDHMPSRLELMRENDALLKKIEKLEDHQATLREKLRLSERIRRYQRSYYKPGHGHVLTALEEKLAAEMAG